MELIRTFARIGKGDVGLAGGKGASLGEMTQAGIPVPPGFVILADAFERFLAEEDLSQELDAILDHVNREEIRSVDQASEKIKQLILSAAMPEDIADEILKSFEELDTEFVAVRSSATAEDSSSAAWAGQLETYLNTTREDVLENVKRCWASLFTPRAIFYRFEKGMHGQKISVAVVIQKMIQSEVSGIAFSVHPVTEDYNHMIIEAGFGLGEAIVSGQVTPDSYVIEKVPRRIIDKNITYQSRALVRGDNHSDVLKNTRVGHGGPSTGSGQANVWRELSEEEGTKPALSDEQALKLAELILKIEKHYGFPCDIEWAYEAGQFFITQSRPITTLAPKKDSAPHEYYKQLRFKKKGRWATYPLDTELWHTPHTSREMEMRFGIWKEILAVCRFGAEYENHMYVPESFVQKIHARIDELTAQDPKAMEKLFMRFYEDKEVARREVPLLNPPELTKLTDAELVELYRKNREWSHKAVICDQFTWLAEDYWPPRMEKVLNARGLKTDSPEYNEALFALVKPREISTTLEEKRAVLKSAFAVKSGTDICAEARRLAKDFGWMPVLAYGTPWDAAWYERELKIASARNASELKEEAAQLDDYTLLRDEGIRRIALKYGISDDDLQIFIDFGLAIDARNEAEYVASIVGFHVLPLYEEIRGRLGLAINELRTLFEDEIVMCLEKQADARSLLETKKGVVAWGLTPDKTRINFTPEQGEEVFAYAEAQTKNIAGTSRGIIANGGKARGVARLVPSPEFNEKVGKGDILIAYSTMVDNLPAMKNAAAIVTESGGITCHAAVVSREFGIPCIVGYSRAMSEFEDGDVVEGDADNGIVRKI